MWTLSSSVGKMFTAASLMMTTRSIAGTSMMKQWLMRRLVRRPVSRLTTAAISSSECRLPFISISALPSRARRTAASAEASLCGASTTSKAEMSSPNCAATASMRAFGPTRIGRMRPICAASTAPRSELSSQGCATAQGAGTRALQRSIRRWYFSCLRSGIAQILMRCRASPGQCAHGARRRPRPIDRNQRCTRCRDGTGDGTPSGGIFSRAAVRRPPPATGSVRSTARALNSIRSRPSRLSSPAWRTTSSTPGFKRRQPDDDAAVRHALFALHQRLQGRVLDVGHAAHVERQHARLVLRDQRIDLLGHVLRVDEEQPPLGPHDQQALEGLVVGVLGRQRPQHVGAALAADDRHARARQPGSPARSSTRRWPPRCP